MEIFISQRLLSPRMKEFSSTLSKPSTLTFGNLYDTTVDKLKKQPEAVRADRTVMQRLVTAYEAKRSVDLHEVASHQLMIIPISI